MNPLGILDRLPIEIRATFQDRLKNGDSAYDIVAWLNTLPEVQASLKAHGRGTQISEEYLTEWKTISYITYCMETLSEKICAKSADLDASSKNGEDPKIRYELRALAKVLKRQTRTTAILAKMVVEMERREEMRNPAESDESKAPSDQNGLRSMF